MSDTAAKIAQLDQRITVVRENPRELIEQAAASSDAAGEELISERIAKQEAELKRLTKQRDELARSRPATAMPQAASAATFAGCWSAVTNRDAWIRGGTHYTAARTGEKPTSVRRRNGFGLRR